MKNYKYVLIGYQREPLEQMRSSRISTQSYHYLCDCQLAGLLCITQFAKSYPSIEVIELRIVEIHSKRQSLVMCYKFDVSQLHNEIVHFKLYDWDCQHSVMLSTEQNK